MLSTALSAQRGASLFVSLILMTALTLVALGSLSTSLMELRMANNTEAGMSAFQQAQAGIDATLASPADYYIVNGSIGDTRCYNIAGCIASITSMPAPISPPEEGVHKVRITRVTSETCPPRTRDSASSCAKLRATSFVSESIYNNSLAGQGQAELAQGYIRLMPAGDNRDTGTSTSDVQN
ncbi:MAG TPA: PilX N-terminal domain-containing pilus assembly protein [Acidiferrobacterales bacterium]|nr:PilX N-terminal domain-containing pilus assembly protein [Acidiferrobacterales bacterium]